MARTYSYALQQQQSHATSCIQRFGRKSLAIILRVSNASKKSIFVSVFDNFTSGVIIGPFLRWTALIVLPVSPFVCLQKIVILKKFKNYKNRCKNVFQKTVT